MSETRSTEASVTPDITIVIISYNTREMTLECLRSTYQEIESSRRARSARVVVVDNGSRDGSAAAIAEAFPRATLLQNVKNRGFGAANNQAFAAAPADYYLLLNSDALPHKGAFDALVDAMDRLPSAAVVGPRLLNQDGSLQMSCYRYPTPGHTVAERLFLTALRPNSRRLGDYRKWTHDREQTVDFVIGACCLVRASACQQVGYFDEDFFLYAEETDWFYRFTRAGWEIWFTPTATVTHLGGGSGGEQAGQVFCEFQSAQERFVRKHFGAPGLAVHRASTLLGAIVRILMFGALSAVKPSQRAQARLWRRIFVWTLGWRGPGLSDKDGSKAAGT